MNTDPAPQGVGNGIFRISITGRRKLQVFSVRIGDGNGEQVDGLVVIAKLAILINHGGNGVCDPVRAADSANQQYRRCGRIVSVDAQCLYQRALGR